MLAVQCHHDPSRRGSHARGPAGIQSSSCEADGWHPDERAGARRDGRRRRHARSEDEARRSARAGCPEESASRTSPVEADPPRRRGIASRGRARTTASHRRRSWTLPTIDHIPTGIPQVDLATAPITDDTEFTRGIGQDPGGTGRRGSAVPSRERSRSDTSIARLASSARRSSPSSRRRSASAASTAGCPCSSSSTHSAAPR